MSGAISSGARAAAQIADELRPQALSAKDYQLIKEVSIDPKELNWVEDEPKLHIFRWTFVLPMMGLAFGYMAFYLRDKYCNLLIPMRVL